VLDFGLAKALDPSPTGSSGAMTSPTITSPALTRLGVILGTASYMSPEQARGRLADKRSDIWAFGCVLYEMLTGRRPFDGEEVSDTLAAVLKSDPDDGVYSLSTLSIADRKTAPWGDVRSESLPTDAVFSPDGRWVAYQTGRSDAGEATTFVQPYPATGAKHQIARGGRPAWSRDGKELFLVPAPGQFMVVNVSTRPSFAFTNPAPVPRGFGIADPGSPRPYDVTPDGRILGVATHGQVQTGSSAATQIRVVLNWFEELKARAPGK
jgi:serine/threonine protein kinase